MSLPVRGGIEAEATTENTLKTTEWFGLLEQIGGLGLRQRSLFYSVYRRSDCSYSPRLLNLHCSVVQSGGGDCILFFFSNCNFLSKVQNYVQLDFALVQR